MTASHHARAARKTEDEALRKPAPGLDDALTDMPAGVAAFLAGNGGHPPVPAKSARRREARARRGRVTGTTIASFVRGIAP